MLRPKKFQDYSHPFALSDSEIDLKKSHRFVTGQKMGLQRNLDALSHVYTDLRYDLYNKVKEHRIQLKTSNQGLSHKIDAIVRAEKSYHRKLYSSHNSPSHIKKMKPHNSSMLTSDQTRPKSQSISAAGSNSQPISNSSRSGSGKIHSPVKDPVFFLPTPYPIDFQDKLLSGF
jgi:hypothetical protein